MNPPHHQTPDLASVLRTLSAYAPAPLQQPQPPQPTPYILEEGEYDPSTYDPSLPFETSQPPQNHAQAIHHPQQQPPQIQAQPTSHLPTSSKPTPPSGPPSQPPRPDPSTITSYPPALRHITQLLTTSPQATARISHLISQQHSHERSWHAGRIGLVEKIKMREERRKEMDSVLRAVGGYVGPRSGGDLDTVSGDGGGIREGGKGEARMQEAKEAEEEEEVRVYDLKVYRACQEMVKATEKEFAGLGVPFFFKGGDKGGLWEGKEEELNVLRARVVGFLEEFCGGAG